MPRVIVLGSGTCVPRESRGPAGYFVETEAAQILVDSGSGTLGRLHQSGYDFRNLTHALYTHTHVDHTADLPALLFGTNYTPDFARQEMLHLIGPSGFSDFVDKLAEPWPWTRPTGDWLKVTELVEDSVAFVDGSVRAASVQHGGIPANAYRIETAGVSIVFSGDTGLCDSIVEISRQADLLIIEASFPEAENPGWHLTASQAGQVATEANVASVVLTHLYPACDAEDMVALCRQTYDGPITVAEDLLRIEV